MTREDFANRMSETLGITKSRAKQEYDDVFYILGEILMEGKELKVMDLGSFVFKERRAKIGRNLKKNEPVLIPARKKLVFEPCKKIKSIINDM